MEQYIKDYIDNNNIKIVGHRNHLKASEKYIDVIFEYADQEKWEGSIPYHYRRTGLLLENPQEVAQIIEKCYVSLMENNSSKWVEKERSLWEKEYKGKHVTKSFFDVLLNLNWNSEFPPNNNRSRRIQEIKEMGYTIATRMIEKRTEFRLIPIDKGPQTGYEYLSPKLRKRIIKVLGCYDAYEGKVRSPDVLLPDHKFPEISWDDKTRQENTDDMSDEEIKAKFQLLDNQRNLEKREACRRVFQTGHLGTIFGIEHYMNGDGNWPTGVPKFGKASEEGWKYCPWYDIESWRRSLNRSLIRS